MEPLYSHKKYSFVNWPYEDVVPALVVHNANFKNQPFWHIKIFKPFANIDVFTVLKYTYSNGVYNIDETVNLNLEEVYKLFGGAALAYLKELNQLSIENIIDRGYQFDEEFLEVCKKFSDARQKELKKIEKITNKINLFGKLNQGLEPIYPKTYERHKK